MIVVFLSLLLACQAVVTDLRLEAQDAQGNSVAWPYEPEFATDTLTYTVYVPLNTVSIKLGATNENDRIWIQILDSGENFIIDFPIYDLSPAQNVVVGSQTYLVKEELQDLVQYTIEVIVTEITTTTDQPSASPSVTVTDEPSASPTVTGTDEPSAAPTVSLESASPTVATTAEPSQSPTTPVPSASPITSPPVVSTTNEAATTASIALPEQSPDVAACDANFISDIWVNLIAQEGDATNECADLTVQSEANEVLTFDDMCACFLVADKDYLSTLNCRPNEATMYTFSDVSSYCYGETAALEGPTDNVISFEKTLESFDTSTWSGVDNEFIQPGQMMRQTFIADDMDQAEENSDYILVEFDAETFGDWEVGDELIVRFGDTEVYRHPVAGSFGTDGEASTHSFVIPLDPYTSTSGNEHTFTLGFTSNLAGNDEYFSVTPTKLETFTREDLSVYCRPQSSHNESVNHPIFEQDASGFVWNYVGSTMDSIRLHLEASVPRHLYDFEIQFDDAQNQLAAFDEDREFADVVSTVSQTYWTSDLLTADNVISSTQDNCGYETWIADIPWDVFNEGGSGGVALMTEYSDGQVVDAATDYYLFGSTIRFDGTESVFVSEGGRDWTTTRDSIWRVPFVVRFQRIIYVESDLAVHLCPDEETNRALCTLTAVTAIVEHIQANTVYDLVAQDYRADVNLRIFTKVFYPYMFITGTKADDPPTYWETYNQVDPYYQPPLDGDSWYAPSIVYTPADFATGTEVEATMSFVSEDEPSCTFENHNDISLNLGRECPQYWNMYIKPLNGACYIDGLYTVTWAARCFYDKPVCWFNDDAQGNRLNTVEVVFDVHSTNMCPELVHDVDVYGVLCPTGRYDYYRCAEAEAANTEDIYTYFQNDEVHFFLETESDSARIIYSRILEIWVEQEYTDYDGSVTPLDMNYNGLTKLWDVSFEPDNDLSWTSSVTGVNEIVPDVMMEIMTSNDFAGSGHSFSGTQGTGDLELGNYAGFTVRLDNRIFPVPSDSFKDVTFRTKVEIWYEGFGDQKPTNRRQLNEAEEQEYQLEGKETIWYETTFNMNQQVPVFLPCFDENSDSFWSYKMTLTDEYMTKYGDNLDTVLHDEMYKLLETNDVSLLGVEGSDNEIIAIYSVNDNQHWNPMRDIFEASNFGKDGLFWFGVDVSDVYCLDAPAGTSVSSLANCANGQPCDFLEDRLLADYTGPINTGDIPAEDSAITLGLVTLFALSVLMF